MENESKSLISVIIPVYNVEKYLPACLESVLKQSYQELEILLVDDGSTDSSGSICEEYAAKDGRIKVIHQENGGVSVARNTGIAACRGEYVGFVDSDDLIHERMFERLLDELQKNHADLSVCDLLRFKESSELKQKTEKAEALLYSQEQYLKKFFKIGSQTIEYYPWNKLYKRELLREDQYPKGVRDGEDIFATLKAVLKAEKIAVFQEELYFYRENPNSVTASFSEKDLGLVGVWDQVYAYMQENAPAYADYALLNRRRTDFTVLFRYAKNVSGRELKADKNVAGLLSDLKKNEKYLLHSSIEFKRRCLIWAFCRNYYAAAAMIYRLYRLRK